MTQALAKPGLTRGIESGSAKDFILPKILLIQKMSKLTEEGAVPGTLVNSLTKKPILDPTFIPVVFSKYWDLCKWKGNERLFDGRVFSETDPKLEGRLFFDDKETGEKATATAVISFICLIDGVLAVVAFSKTSYRAGKKLYTLAATSKKDLFATTYRLSVNKRTNDHGTFWQFDVEAVGEPTPEQFQEAEAYYNTFHKKVEQVHAAPPAEDEEYVPS